MNNLPKPIFLVGYFSSNGNLVPCFYFDSEENFESWFYDNEVLSGNLKFFKLSIPFFEDLDSTSKVKFTHLIKHPLI